MLQNKPDCPTTHTCSLSWTDPLHQHNMEALCSLLEHEGEVEFQPSPFFNEQLTAFELWLEHGSSEKKPPEQLPIVLQVRIFCQTLMCNHRSCLHTKLHLLQYQFFDLLRQGLGVGLLSLIMLA